LSSPNTQIKLPPELIEPQAHWWPEWVAQNSLSNLDAEMLEIACGLSVFVSQTCQRNTSLVIDIVQAGYLRLELDVSAINNLAEMLMGEFNATEEMNAGLRRLRRAVAFILAVRDLAGVASLEEVTQGMSDLAALVLDRALEHLWRLQCTELGVPEDSSGQPMRMFVLGLGKLGGRELNFSSDIDLIFAYPEDGELPLDGIESSSMVHQTFFERLSQSLITSLHKITSDGQVFRVDMRLRPYGGSGPVILSMPATIRYYTTRGRDWERYALVKARAIAGDKEAAEELLNDLRPFVYRRYIDYGAINEIRRMKRMISEQLDRKGKAFNVKLGRGGIREIEFFVQAFQIVHAGRDAELRTPFLSVAISELKKRKMVPNQDLDEMMSAYLFLRRLEHRLQIYRDEQTHTLSDKLEVQLVIAVAMGCPDYASLLEELDEVTTRVHGYFDDLFGEDEQLDSEALDWQRFWESTDDKSGGMKDTALNFLSGQGFVDVEHAFALIFGYREGRFYRPLTGTAQARVDRLIPEALVEIVRTSDPEATLRRFISLLERIAARSTYVALLCENPDALQQLIQLIAQSEWAASWIANYPAILDSLLVPMAMVDLQDPEYLRARFEDAAKLLAENDLERALDALREAHHSRTLRIAAGFLAGSVSVVEAGSALALQADTALEVALEMAQTLLQGDLGSACASGESLPIGVLAYGKLGSRELGYGSDLDIVLIYDELRVLENTEAYIEEGQQSVAAEVYFAKLCQKLVFLLTTTTSAGRLYEIDMRLRPSGQSGLLVTTVKSFRKYQMEKAQLWEHHALARSRVAIGDDKLRQRITEIRKEALTLRRTKSGVLQHMIDMRKRMRKEHDKSTDELFDLKQGSGGLVDIEFIAQAAVLVHAKKYPDLLEEHTTPSLLLAAADCEFLDKDVALGLASIYKDYLTIEHRYKLTNKPAYVPRDEVQKFRNSVEFAWQTLL
jgi:[glutamine synthetase] adenylyltransferase / [glutamine synthetase]-adenylyl-L-tyrosine phosphorylase